MLDRGRSRNVSPVALARQASEERRQPRTPPADMSRQPQQDRADKRAVHETQRVQRLRAREKLWEDEKNRLHADKLRAVQRREQLALEHEQARLADRALHHRTRSRLDTPLSPKRDHEPFQYPFMTPPCRSSRPAKKPLPHTTSHNRSVPFKEVITAMNGSLFPLDASERTDDARRIAGLPIANPAPHRRRASVRAELLDSLLQVVEWQQGERRKAKGKQVDRSHHPSNSPLHPHIPMPSVPSSASVTSLSSYPSQIPSRSGSWLSFGSWRSSATDITTPDSPVPGSPATSQPCLLPTLIEHHRDPRPRCALVRISVEDSPLCPSLSSHHVPSLVEDVDLPACLSGVETLGVRGTLVMRVTRSVATIVEAAKGLQSAYITATMFTAGPPSARVTASQPCGSVRCQRQLRREGYRALSKDVQMFTDSISPISQASEPVHFIPLTSLQSGTAGLPKPPVIKSAIIFPSPLRPRTPPAALAYRMRPVANPAVLRLKALQNLMCARGKQWEGRAREGGLGCGKERMLGVAFEGRGPSGLGCEVRFVVA